MPDEFEGSVLGWAFDRLGLGIGNRQGLIAALMSSRSGCGLSSTEWGLELHHDGTDRVDLSVFTPGPPGPSFDIAGIAVTPGGPEVWEYDLAVEGTYRLAGVFHGIDRAELPEPLTGLPAPEFIAHLTGRQGQVRLLFPARRAGWDELILRLAEGGVDVGRLRGATPFVVAGLPVRVAVDYLPWIRRLSGRLGVEVFCEPATHDIEGTLLGLGVPLEAVQRMSALAHSVPFGRERSLRIPSLPGTLIDRSLDSVQFSHMSVSWTDGEALVKSYLLVRSAALSDSADGPASP